MVIRDEFEKYPAEETADGITNHILHRIDNAVGR